MYLSRFLLYLKILKMQIINFYTLYKLVVSRFLRMMRCNLVVMGYFTLYEMCKWLVFSVIYSIV